MCFSNLTMFHVLFLPQRCHKGNGLCIYHLMPLLSDARVSEQFLYKQAEANMDAAIVCVVVPMSLERIASRHSL